MNFTDDRIREIAEIIKDKYYIEDRCKDYDSASFIPSVTQITATIKHELNSRIAKANETLKRWGNHNN